MMKLLKITKIMQTIKKSCVHFKSIVSKMSVALGQNILFNFNMYLLYMLIGFTIALSIALVKQRDRIDSLSQRVDSQQIEIVELKSNWEYYINIINPEVKNVGEIK